MTRFPYKPGDALAICDRCGFQFYLSELQEEWSGAKVCPADFEERHPQEFARGVPERIYIQGARPPAEDVFVEPGDITADDL